MDKPLVLKILLFVCLASFVACRTETQEHTSTFAKQCINGKSIEVKRSDSFTKYYGIITGINWSNGHSFKYDFSIQPDDYKWTGTGEQVPLKLLFCNDELYLRVRGEKVLVDTAKIDSIPRVIRTDLYFKNVDDRYFFNWFGDQYFEEIDSLKYYENKLGCKEENIPVQSE